MELTVMFSVLYDTTTIRFFVFKVQTKSTIDNLTTRMDRKNKRLHAACLYYEN